MNAECRSTTCFGAQTEPAGAHGIMTGLTFTLRRPSLTVAITGPARGGALAEDELVVQPGRTGWNDLRAGSGVDCRVRPMGRAFAMIRRGEYKRQP